MKYDQEKIENELRRRAVRALPAEWRAQILATARAATSQAPAVSSTLLFRWREWLWPCPQAWAAVAAGWVVIIALQLNSPRPPRVQAENKSARTEQVRMAMAEQRKLLAQVLGSEAVVVAERPKQAIPQRRSELPAQFEMA